MDSAALTLTLFAHGWLHFNHRSLCWSGTRHEVSAPEIRGEEIMDLITFTNAECGPGTDLNDVCATALKGMQAVADADGVRVPRPEVAPGLLELLPEGDVTGISLVTLLHEPQLWNIEQTGPDVYAIEYDSQLARALPHCEQMLTGIVDALRSVDPEFSGEATYALAQVDGGALGLGDAPEPCAVVETAAEPEPEPVPEAEPAPVSTAELEPEPEPEPEPESTLMPEPKAEPEPEPEPEPQPEAPEESANPTFIECEGLIIDMGAHAVKVDGHEVTLTRHEYDLLVELATHPNVPLSREAIFEAIWGTECAIDPRAIDSHIKNLRAKLNDDASNPRFIKSAHGFGYRFVGEIIRSTCAVRDTRSYEVEAWLSDNDERMLTISSAAHLVTVDDKTIDLSRTEFATLAALSSRHGDVWTNEELSMEVLGIGFEASGRTIATHIKNVRIKLGDSARNPSWVKTVHGVGYRMTGTFIATIDDIPETEPTAKECPAPALEERPVASGCVAQADDAPVEPQAHEDEIPAREDVARDQNAERLAAKRAHEQEAMANLEFPEFPQELLAIEPDIHAGPTRYAVALYTIARVVPDTCGFTLVQLRRIVRPYMLSAGLMRLSVPTLSAACTELAARGLGRLELDESGGIALFHPVRLSAEEALRVAMEFDTLGPYDPALHVDEHKAEPAPEEVVKAVDPAGAPEPEPEPEAEPEPMPQPISEAPSKAAVELEPEPMPEPEAEPEPMPEPISPAEPTPEPEVESIPEPEVEPAPAPDPEQVAQLEAQIAWATEKLAALDPAPLRDRLDELTKERESLGFFKFSAKKELDAKIADLKQKLDDLTRRDADRVHFQTLIDDCTRKLDALLNAQ